MPHGAIGPQVLGVVGARSGSTGVPNKNIRPLAGRPLIGWIISAALASRHIGRLIVSTDSAEYADVARGCGAEVPYLRPPALARDDSADLDYVTHLLDWLDQNERYRPDIIVRLMATVPLQTPEDIDGSIEPLLHEPDTDSVVVIAEARQHPLKALKLVDDGTGGHLLVTYFTDSGREVTPIPRQRYEKAYFRANVIACRRRVIYETGSLTGDRVRAYVIPQERALDIDSIADFALAEMLLERREVK